MENMSKRRGKRKRNSHTESGFWSELLLAIRSFAKVAYNSSLWRIAAIVFSASLVFCLNTLPSISSELTKVNQIRDEYLIYYEDLKIIYDFSVRAMDIESQKMKLLFGLQETLVEGAKAKDANVDLKPATLKLLNIFDWAKELNEKARLLVAESKAKKLLSPRSNAFSSLQSFLFDQSKFNEKLMSYVVEINRTAMLTGSTEAILSQIASMKSEVLDEIPKSKERTTSLENGIREMQAEIQKTMSEIDDYKRRIYLLWFQGGLAVLAGAYIIAFILACCFGVKKRMVIQSFASRSR